MIIPFVFISLVFLANSDGQEVITFKNATHVTCVTDNDTAPIYVGTLKKQDIRKNNLLTESNAWTDWNLQDSSTTLNAPVVDKRWEDFDLTATSNISLSGKAYTCFSVFRPDDLIFYISDDDTTNFYKYWQRQDNDWVHFSVYVHNKTFKISANFQPLTSFKAVPSGLAIKTNESKFWKIHDYPLRVAQKVSQTFSNISLSSSDGSCLVIYAYLCEYCFLDIHFGGFKNQTLRGRNTSQNGLYLPQYTKLEKVSKISLRRYTTNGNLEGYWAVDIRRCPSTKSDHVVYEAQLPNITDEKDIRCRFLEQTVLTNQSINEDIFHCKKTGVFGQKCNIFCKELFEGGASSCRGFNVTLGNLQWHNALEYQKTTYHSYAPLYVILSIVFVVIIAGGYYLYHKREKKRKLPDEIPLIGVRVDDMVEKKAESQPGSKNMENISTDDNYVDDEPSDWWQKQFPEISDRKKKHNNMKPLTCALYALKLAADENISDFEITTKDKDGKLFNDIRLEITFKDDRKCLFLFQLYNKSKTGPIKSYILTKKKSINNNFYLPHLLQSIANHEDSNVQNVHYILYWDKKSDIADGSKLFFDENKNEKKDTSELPKGFILAKKLLPTKDLTPVINSGGESLIFTFDLENMSEDVKSLTSASKKFYLFTDQDSDSTPEKKQEGSGSILEKKLEDALRKLLSDTNVKDLFKSFIQDWYFQDINYSLTKDRVLMKLTELALSPFIKNISAEKSNDKTNLLKQAIMNFNITIIEEDNEDIIANIWQENSYKTQYSDSEKSKILWEWGIVPLIIKIDDKNQEQVERVVNLLEQNKVSTNLVLLGKCSRELKLNSKKEMILKDFTDVTKHRHSGWYSRMIKSFQISLQGRSSFSLKHLMSIDQSFAESITLRHLIEMSQKNCLLIGDDQQLPEIYIPRNVFKGTEVNEETEFIQESEILDTFKDPVNLLCAPPGMGKTMLLRRLQRLCPKDSWTVYIELKKLVSELEKNPNPENVLSVILQQSEDPLVLKLQEILIRKRKVEVFLDGFDQLDSNDHECVIKYIQELAKKGTRIWISSREHLCDYLKNSLNVKPMGIQELNRQQQEHYIRKKFEGRTPNRELGIIFTVGNYSEILGNPLHLNILTEMKTTKLTKLFEQFFEEKKKRNEEQVVTESDFEPYELPALKSCLDSDDFDKLELDFQETETFLSEVRSKGDQLGVIKKTEEGQKPIFEYQTFAEYFASVWLKKNKDVLNKFPFLSHKYVSLRRTFDFLLAEKNPLHWAVSNQDLDGIKKHLEKMFGAKDESGRTALHLACSYGKECLFEKSEPETAAYVQMIDKLLDKCPDISQKDDLFSLDCVGYAVRANCYYPLEAVLKRKLCDFEKNREASTNMRENLKQFSLFCAKLGYINLLENILAEDPELVNAKFPEETTEHNLLAEDSKVDNGKSPEKSTEHNLLYYALMGCKSANEDTKSANTKCAEFLLKQKKESLKLNSEELIEVLNRSCIAFKDLVKFFIENDVKFSDDNNILHVIIQQKKINNALFAQLQELKPDVNVPNEKGETILHFASQKGAVNDVEKILLLGGDNTILDNDGNNVLHWTCKSKKENKEMIEFWLRKKNYLEYPSTDAEKIENRRQKMDINSKNKKQQTPLYFACEEGSAENVKYLQEKFADFNVVDESGNTLLHAASKFEEIKIQLKAEENTTSETNQDKSSSKTRKKQTKKTKDLSKTKNDNNEEIIEMVLQKLGKSFDINVKNKENKTALDLACSTGNQKTQEVLRRLGAKTSEEI